MNGTQGLEIEVFSPDEEARLYLQTASQYGDVFTTNVTGDTYLSFMKREYNILSCLDFVRYKPENIEGNQLTLQHSPAN